MARWFWLFVCYSFFGYLLEKLYARWTKAQRQVRKCFLLLPLCPVYGIAMCASAALAGRRFGGNLLLCTLVCTLAEYAVHLFYDKVLHVRFWDYRGERGNLAGRVCPRFSLLWGLLGAVALEWVQPALEGLASRIPAPVTFLVWMVLALDTVLTLALLGRYHDTEALCLEWVLRSGPPASPAHPDRRTGGSSR